MATRSGKVVVAIVLTVGLGLGALGSWFLVRSRPVPGDFVDVVALADGGAVVIRHQRGEPRDMIEVHDRQRLRWRALIPPYAGTVGAPMVAATAKVVTVRVVRDGHPFVFAFDVVHGSKLASFDLATGAPPDARAYAIDGVGTAWAGAWAVETVALPGAGARLFALALDEHRVAWKADLAARPTRVWLGSGGQVRAAMPDGISAWDLATGESRPARSDDVPPPPGPGYVTATGFGWSGGGKTDHVVPAGAVAPQRYHLAGGRAWVVTPTQLVAVDGPLGVTRTIAR